MALETGVRDLWNRLHDAGLPSLATHRHPSNRPHLTVVTAPSIAGLALGALPVAAELGPVRRLGRALVLLVTPTPELRDLHARVWSSLPGAWPPPQEWVPHVSLALRFPTEAAVADVPLAHGRWVAARSYDTETRTVVDL